VESDAEQGAAANSRCPFSFRMIILHFHPFSFAQPRPHSSRLWLSFLRSTKGDEDEYRMSVGLGKASV